MPRIAELLAEGLRGEGVDVTLLPWGGGGGGSVVQRLFGRVRQVHAIRRAVRASHPDVVLVQTSHDWACILRDAVLAFAIRRSGCSVVLQLHGSRADRLVAPGARAFKRATKHVLRLTDGVLVLSTEEARAFVACEPHAKVQAVTNPFAVETEAPSRRRGTGPPLVLFAGRLLWEKGVLDTIEAFALLRKRMDVRLLIAGDGPAAEDVRGAVARHGLVDDVRVAGRLDRARLDRVYREAAAFVLPTYHPEGFPTALSEAMSAGLPIVTTPSRGSADHLIDGTNALFVPPRDPSALADALERVLTDRALAARMSEANLAKVEEFAPERVAPAYVAALSEMRS